MTASRNGTPSLSLSLLAIVYSSDSTVVAVSVLPRVEGQKRQTSLLRLGVLHGLRFSTCCGCCSTSSGRSEKAN